MEGNEAILGPEVISGGVGLEPAFNRKKKIFHVAILRRKYLIMTFPPYLSISVRLQNVLSYENTYEGVFFVRKAVKKILWIQLVLGLLGGGPGVLNKILEFHGPK